MADWRDKLIAADPEEPQGLPLRSEMRLRLTGSGFRALTSHVKAQGRNSREQWVREAVVEKMLREGATEVPEMSPYTGHRLLREITW